MIRKESSSTTRDRSTHASSPPARGCGAGTQAAPIRRGVVCQVVLGRSMPRPGGRRHASFRKIAQRAKRPSIRAGARSKRTSKRARQRKPLGRHRDLCRSARIERVAERGGQDGPSRDEAGDAHAAVGDRVVVGRRRLLADRLGQPEATVRPCGERGGVARLVLLPAPTSITPPIAARVAEARGRRRRARPRPGPGGGGRGGGGEARGREVGAVASRGRGRQAWERRRDAGGPGSEGEHDFPAPRRAARRSRPSRRRRPAGAHHVVAGGDGDGLAILDLGGRAVDRSSSPRGRPR